MKTTNLKNPVRASWIRELGFRLDAGPFISGALEAKKKLESLSVVKDTLGSLTFGHKGGIYNGPQFTRNYVNDAAQGVQFMTASGMMLSDLSMLPLLSRRNALSPKLSYLKLKPGMTLISCSGTIGRTVYSRPEMDGVWSSQDVIKVVPSVKKVPPGYVFAFLSSKFGLPIVTASTYGSIIPHLEPEHIVTLPVPRFGKQLEQRVDDLVQEAAELRSAAGAARQTILIEIEEYVGWERRLLSSLSTSCSSLQLTRRMDGFHHSATVREARTVLSSHSDSAILAEVVDEVYEPNRGSRRKVDDGSYGVPFLSSSAVFRLAPTAEYYVSHNTPQLERLLLTDRDLLIPRSGQLGGIIGRAVLPLPNNVGSAGSEHLVRIRCKSRDDAHYLWGIFACQAGYYAAIGTAFGTSIPSLDCQLISRLAVPWNQGKIREKIITVAGAITANLDQAIFLERNAIQLVEDAIEGDS